MEPQINASQQWVTPVYWNLYRPWIIATDQRWKWPVEHQNTHEWTRQTSLYAGLGRSATLDYRESSYMSLHCHFNRGLASFESWTHTKAVHFQDWSRWAYFSGTQKIKNHKEGQKLQEIGLQEIKAPSLPTLEKGCFGEGNGLCRNWQRSQRLGKLD